MASEDSGGVGADSDGAADSAGSSGTAREVASTAQPSQVRQQQAIISTGVVSLIGADVAKARFDVQKIVAVHDGEVSDEKNQTAEDGEMTRSRMVLRIPVEDFDTAMASLEKVAQLESSSRNSEDVTTEVIDTKVRIRAQAESLKRVEVLLARAESIRDIVSIEAQLTRRQADLDSLKSRQAYLEDQTSMGTITVFLEKKPEPVEKKKAEKEEAGFFAGLSNGWDGMTTFLVGLATVAGTLLPFAILLLIFGVPTWLLVRGLGRRRPRAHACRRSARGVNSRPVSALPDAEGLGPVGRLARGSVARTDGEVEAEGSRLRDAGAWERDPDQVLRQAATGW